MKKPTVNDENHLHSGAGCCQFFYWRWILKKSLFGLSLLFLGRESDCKRRFFWKSWFVFRISFLRVGFLKLWILLNLEFLEQIWLHTRRYKCVYIYICIDVYSCCMISLYVSHYFFLGVPWTLLDSTILITSDSNQPFKGTQIFCHEIVNNELQKNDVVQWKR